MIEFVASEAYTRNRFLGLHFGTLIDHAVRVNDFECWFDFETGVVEARLPDDTRRLCVIQHSNGRLLPFTGLLVADTFSIEVTSRRLQTKLAITLVADGEHTTEEFGLGRSNSSFDAFRNSMQVTTGLHSKSVRILTRPECSDAAIVIAAILTKFYVHHLRVDAS